MRWDWCVTAPLKVTTDLYLTLVIMSLQPEEWIFDQEDSSRILPICIHRCCDKYLSSLALRKIWVSWLHVYELSRRLKFDGFSPTLLEKLDGDELFVLCKLHELKLALYLFRQGNDVILYQFLPPLIFQEQKQKVYYRKLRLALFELWIGYSISFLKALPPFLPFCFVYTIFSSCELWSKDAWNKFKL